MGGHRPAAQGGPSEGASASGGDSSSASRKRKAENTDREKEVKAKGARVAEDFDPAFTIEVYWQNPLQQRHLDDFYKKLWGSLIGKDESDCGPEEIVLRAGRIRLLVSDLSVIPYYKRVISSLTPNGGKAGDWKPYGPSDPKPFKNFVTHVGPRAIVADNLSNFGGLIRRQNKSIPKDEYFEAVSCFPRPGGKPGFVVRVRVGLGALPALEALGRRLRYELAIITLIEEKGVTGGSAGSDPQGSQDEAQQ